MSDGAVTSGESIQVSRAFHVTYIPDAVLDDPRVERAELLTYLALCRFADRDGASWPSIKTIAKKARLSESAVKLALKGLVSKGLLSMGIRRKPGSQERSSNLYRLLDGVGGSTSDPRGSVFDPPVGQPVARKDSQSEGLPEKGEEIAPPSSCEDHQNAAAIATETVERIPVEGGNLEIKIKSPERIAGEDEEIKFEVRMVYLKHAEVFPDPTKSVWTRILELSHELGGDRFLAAFGAWCSKRPGRALRFFLEDIASYIPMCSQKPRAAERKPTEIELLLEERRRESVAWGNQYSCPRCGAPLGEAHVEGSHACLACGFAFGQKVSSWIVGGQRKIRAAEGVESVVEAVA